MNLLTERVFTIEAGGHAENLTLPDVLAALVCDKVDCFPALRAHQMPAWHMFLVQLGAIAVHRGGLSAPPTGEAEWHRIIRALTSAEFPDDEPWRLIVDNHAKPAFLQPPVPEGKEYKDDLIPTPDALDMVITSKNHDLKGAVAWCATAEDWIFALMSLQTCEGVNGNGKYGVARMNGGSSSRVCLGLVPMAEPTPDKLELRPGIRLRRDLEQLAARRAVWLEPLTQLYPQKSGAALLWALPWPDGESLPVTSLDPLFIEVCRRVRLKRVGASIVARDGTSAGARVAAKDFKGVLGDPWAPVNRTEATSLTLTDRGDFNYSTITRLFSGDWKLPLLATLGPGETEQARNWALVAQAFARGNSKTGGFKERVIPVTGKVAGGLSRRREELHTLATYQINEVDRLSKVLRDAIALAAVGGDRESVNEDAYAAARPYRDALRGEADRLFFPALWKRFEAEEQGGDAASAARAEFLRDLDRAAVRLLEDALADLPCASVQRPRAEARARTRYYGGRRKAFEGVEFSAALLTEATHADA